MWHAGCVALLAALLACGATTAAAQEGPPQRPDTRQVMFVGNNWEGTADIVDARTFERLARINTIPDKEERLAEIQRDPVRLGFFLAIRQAVGEGNDQFTDDMFTSHDGRFVYVSRPSFADVVAISLETRQIVWRFPMEGQRADHMGISPDGESLLVSDSTANKVHRLDSRTGRKTGEFPSGDSPHENNYSKDGSLIFHASIGRVYTPTDQALIPPLELIRDTTKGERYFQVVNANTMQVLKRVDMGQKLEEAGYPEMESAVRPMALSPDEKTIYAQISFHHGFIEYDLESDRVTRVANLPLSEEAQATPREQYLLDSAHHGLAINPEGTKLCAAGTMSDYAAIVRRDTFAHTILPIGEKPYWSTNGLGGTHCWLSVSGDDKVVIIDYASERQVAQVPVGDHPQRVRLGAVRHTTLAGLPMAPGARDNAPPHIRVLKPKRCRSKRLRARIRIFDQSRLRYAAARAPGRSKKTRRKRFRLTVPVKRLDPGRHRIRVRAKDTAGNFSRKVVRFRRCR
jgi:DNA-binding beta-propeller fold protein YncE